MKKIMLIAICMMMAMAVNAQKYTVSGIIVDQETNEVMIGVSVQILNAQDGKFVSGAATDANGSFTVKDLEKGKYKVKVSYVGYVTREQNLELSISKAKKNTDLGFITLNPDNVMLAQTEVTANAAKVKVSGDSIIFNASAFRTPAGSTLEALVRKLPGAKVDENGQITINGKTVNKIMVNGKEFFLNDTQVAMQNIPVDIIDNIKSYDRKSDMARVTGIDDGEDETVLDLSVKKGMSNGWFGQLNGGAGTQHRYASRANIMRFADTYQLTLLGGMNNVNDMGFGGPGGRGMGGFGGFGGGGLRSSKNGGFNFATTGDKLETGGSIRYTYNGSDSRNETSTENFISQDIRSFKESLSQSYGSNMNLNTQFRLEWKPDSMTNIILRPSYTYSRNRGSSNSMNASYNDDPNEVSDNPLNDSFAENEDIPEKLLSIIVNKDINRQQSYSTNNNFNGTLQANRKLNDDGRNITLRVNGTVTNGESQQLSAAKISFNPNMPSTINNRYNTNPTRTRNLSAELTYSEPIGYKTYLQFGYRYGYNYNKNDRQAFIYHDLAYEKLNQALINYRYDIDGIINYMLTENFDLLGKDISDEAKKLCQSSEYKTYQHTGSISLRKVTDHANFSVGMEFIPINTSLDYVKGDDPKHITKNQFNFAPRIEYRWNKNRQTQLRVNYRGRMNQPSLTNLLDIRNDDDTLNITVGNPNLKPSFNHNISLNYNTYNVDTQSSFFGFANGGFTQNNISSIVEYDPATGIRKTTPENINGTWNVMGGGGFNISLDEDLYYTLDAFTNVNYNNNVGYTFLDNKNVKSTTKTLGLGEDLSLSYRRDLIEISLNGNVNYNHSKNDISSAGNQDTWMFGYGAEFQYTTNFGLTLTTDIGMNSRRGYAQAEMNTDELLWNAQISQTLLGGNLTLMLEVNDILGEQSNISRTINAMMRSDSRTNSIYQYGMLRATYRFNAFGNMRSFGFGRRGGMPMGGMPMGGMPMGGMPMGGMPMGGGFGGGFGGGMR